MLKIVSDFLSAVLSVLASIIFVHLILKTDMFDKCNKNSISKLVIIIFLASISFCVFNFMNLPFLKALLSFFVFLLIFKKVFGLNFIKAFILDFFYFILLIFSDMLVIKICTLIVGDEAFYTNLAGGFICNFAVFIIVLLMSLLFKKVIYKFLNVNVKYKLIFLLIISIFCIIAVFFAGFQFGANSIDKMLCLFCILVIVSTLSYSFAQIYKNDQLISQYDNLLSFIKKYEVEIDNQRIMRHETRNQLLTIKSKIIDREENNSIINYIDIIIKDSRKVNHSEYAKLHYLPSNGIKGLFYFKISLAQDNGISVDVNISKSVENSFLNNLSSLEFNQIGKVLGVYLDNAIEASEKTSKKIIGIEAFKDKNEIIFIISNTYNSNIKVFGRSSKGEDRGYGLLLVNNILNVNSKLNSFTEITDKLYIKKLVIKK